VRVGELINGRVKSLAGIGPDISVKCYLNPSAASKNLINAMHHHHLQVVTKPFKKHICSSNASVKQCMMGTIP
jgi:hypothetical protein